MNSTSFAERRLVRRREALSVAIGALVPFAFADAAATALLENTMTEKTIALLSPKQLALGPIAANMAIGDMPALATALNQGLDADLSVAEVKEVLVQLYAYAGFPRALNALGEMMKVVEDRRARGLKDKPGREPAAVPTGQALVEVGTANQTQLSGAPVKGPLFEFAPAIDQFLKAHLFGDVFARDNLDWQSRELATVGALSAMSGVEPQLLAHIRISMNVGLSTEQLRQFAAELSARGAAEASRRLVAGLDKQAASSAKS